MQDVERGGVHLKYPWRVTVDDSGRPSPASRPRGSATHDLERYASLLASRTRVMTSSAMRDLMAITERPEVISLAGGLPDVSGFPPQMLERVAKAMTDGAGPRRARRPYGPTEGMAKVHEAIQVVMAEEGTQVDLGELLVTTGGQQAIDLVCKTLVDPGDVVLAEGPTYPGAIPSFTAYQADVRQLEMDEHGLRIDLLEETLDQLDEAGIRPKFLYTIPTFQNPAGVTMSLERRKQLVKIAQERELLVVEDSPYSLLRYEGDPLPTLRSLDGGNYVIYLGTFSKILAAGLRIGWIAAPRAIRQKMNIGKQGADLCSPSTSQVVIEACFQDLPLWRSYLEDVKGRYQGRRDVMLSSLAHAMPEGTSWTRPEGGLFLWVTLPEALDTTDLLARALRSNVAFVPGRAAYTDGRGGHSMRVNFSGVNADDIHEGVRRIGDVVFEQLELYGDVMGEAPPKRRATDRPTGAKPPVDDAPEQGALVEFPRRRSAERPA
ncbi:MAG: PLP-dependent aminotransferase family protein [Solirubrobacteraceae bacterium]|nr:PLP-dependent aminotransferase family protein [Solirubrobacteraceae bacterium]